jgi:predicted metalloprotease
MLACRSALVLIATVLCMAGGIACAGEDTDRLREDATRRAQDVRERAERARADAEQVSRRARQVRARAERTRERITKRVRDVLEDLRKAVPEATQATRAPASRGRTDPDTVPAYLDEVLADVERYWARTLTASGLDAPQVRHLWVEPGDSVRTRCGARADDNAAFYCPADDTIYVAERLASELWQGISDDFPGQRAGYGRAIGDFGVAYLLAHEYAHNVQFELGFYELNRRVGVKAFELQADCMAGLWSNAVYREGRLKPGDVEEAIGTALAVGDFDYFNANHHGTPVERREAWLAGYSQGDPRRCQEYVPA